MQSDGLKQGSTGAATAVVEAETITQRLKILVGNLRVSVTHHKGYSHLHTLNKMMINC